MKCLSLITWWVSSSQECLNLKLTWNLMMGALTLRNIWMLLSLEWHWQELRISCDAEPSWLRWRKQLWSGSILYNQGPSTSSRISNPIFWPTSWPEILIQNQWLAFWDYLNDKGNCEIFSSSLMQRLYWLKNWKLKQWCLPYWMASDLEHLKIHSPNNQQKLWTRYS